MALINTTTTGVLGSTFYGDGSGDLTVQKDGVTVNKVTSAPAFSAYAGTTTTLTAATDVKIAFDTEIFDTNNNFASSRFTPTIAGYYQINANANMNYWNGIIYSILIYKNGSAYQYGQTVPPQTTGGVRASVSSIVYCNGSTDYIEIYGWQYAASTSNVVAAGSSLTWFNGALLRAA
jgi:hypothetical protein